MLHVPAIELLSIWYPYHSCPAVYGMNYRRPLENWGRGFECHSRHGCLCAFVLCVGSGLVTVWSPVEGVLPTVYRIARLKKRPGPNKVL
jgi:hypothetical protein